MYRIVSGNLIKTFFLGILAIFFINCSAKPLPKKDSVNVSSTDKKDGDGRSLDQEEYIDNPNSEVNSDAFVAGDCNGDSVVSASELSLIKNWYLNQNATPCPYADVNGNRKIELAELVISYVNKKFIPNFASAHKGPSPHLTMKFGDCDNDNIVEVSEAISLVNKPRFEEYCLNNIFDLNLDGRIDPNDKLSLSEFNSNIVNLSSSEDGNGDGYINIIELSIYLALGN